MIIERLSLRGMLRFTDTVDLDFRQLPPGLIALVAPNGAGKSTLLEAPIACLFRQFASRDGKLTGYATARDSFIDVEFSVSGRGAYHARVSLDGLKDGSDAVIELVNPDGSKSVLNDGKVSTYDDLIRREFPSLDLVLASAFAAQNKRGSFISKKPRERKDLFVELLALKAYERMSDTAKTAAGFVEQARVKLLAARDALAQQVPDSLQQALDREAQELQVSGGTAEADREDIEKRIADLEARLDTMGDAVAAFGAASQKIQALQADLAGRRADLDALGRDRARLEAQLATDLQRIDRKLDADLQAVEAEITSERIAFERELAGIEQKRAANEKDCQTKIAGNQQILGMAEQIRAAVALVAQQTSALDAARKDVEAKQAAHREAADQVLRCERDLAALTAPVRELDRAKADAALIETVPFGPKCAQASCQFVANASAALARIPVLEATVAKKADLETKHRESDAAATTALTALAQARQQVQSIQQTLTEQQAFTKYVEPLAAAEARIKELQERIEQSQRDAEQAIQQAEERHAARATALQARKPKLAADADAAKVDAHQRAADGRQDLHVRETALTATITRLETDLKSAQAALDLLRNRHEAATALQGQLREARGEYDRLTAVIATVKAETVALQRRREDFANTRRRCEDLTATLVTLDTELVEWRTLQDGLGPNGLPVLEIDAAGPTISGYVNELLAVCFGPRFSVDLVTQQEKASGKGMKEAFTLRVLDNLRNVEHDDVAGLSGGEQVIVSEALMLAIGIYVNTRSPMPIRTLWRDETTGALDPENAIHYVEMLRKAREMGGYHFVFFITHNPDAAALADAQIRINETGEAVVVRIVQPPYLQEAA